jgi:hypothetical protein
MTPDPESMFSTAPYNPRVKDMTREQELEARVKDLEATLQAVRAHLEDMYFSTGLTALGRDEGRANKKAALALIDTALKS